MSNFKVDLINPWSGRVPMSSAPWFLPGEAARIGRHNSRVMSAVTSAKNMKGASNALRRLVAPQSPSGSHPIPLQWAGNPWEAPVLLLLMNPSWGAVEVGSTPQDLRLEHNEGAKKIESNQILQSLLDRTARGAWDPDYPNPFLHPLWRKHDSWHPRNVFSSLHQELTNKFGLAPEDAWKRLSQRVCVLEISPWASLEWTSGCIGPTARLSADLADAARQDPERIVLVGRGADEWRKVGFLDVDLCEKSKGIRSHQVKISAKNFPNSYGGVLGRIAP